VTAESALAGSRRTALIAPQPEWRQTMMSSTAELAHGELELKQREHDRRRGPTPRVDGPRPAA